MGWQWHEKYRLKIAIFSKTKLVLPKVILLTPLMFVSKEVNKLLTNCGCETFPTKPLADAIQKSNFFLPYRMN